MLNTVNVTTEKVQIKSPENKISNIVPRRKRIRNRLGLWMWPIAITGFLVGGVALTFATGGATAVLPAIEAAIGTGWNYIIGAGLFGLFDKFVLFPKRTKYARYENAIYRKQKGITRLNRKMARLLKNYQARLARAEVLLQHGAANDQNFKLKSSNAKRIKREYLNERDRMNQLQRRIANLNGKINAKITGERRGVVSKFMAPITGPLNFIRGKKRGLINNIEAFNDVADAFNEKKRDAKNPYGKFKYDSNLLEVKQNLREFQNNIENFSVNTKALDKTATLRFGKEYDSKSGVFGRLANVLRMRPLNPQKMFDNVATNKIMLDEREVVKVEDFLIKNNRKYQKAVAREESKTTKQEVKKEKIASKAPTGSTKTNTTASSDKKDAKTQAFESMDLNK